MRDAGAGQYYSAYVTTEGTLYTFGRNTYGQLGCGSTAAQTEPTEIMSGADAVSTGFNHCAAIDKSGAMFIWGNSDSGCLGNGCTVDSLIPQPLGILSERLWGDVNRDGTVSINDVTALQGHIAELDKLDAESVLTGDINGDGVTDIGDATEIQRFLAEMTDKFPVES